MDDIPISQIPHVATALAGGELVGTQNGVTKLFPATLFLASVSWSQVTDKPSFATVATSGAYADLTGRPSLATVATSGAYGDLSGRPTLGTAAAANSAAFAPATHTHAQSDITELSSTLASLASSILDKAYAGAVGSSGLTMATARILGRSTAGAGAPEEITIGSGLSLSGGTLTATGGGGGGAVDSVAGLTGEIGASALRSALGLAAVATSGAYADITGKPALASVALSGAYGDLTGRPTLGTAAAASTGDFAAASHTHAQGDITGLSTALAGKASTGAITGAGLTMATARLVGRTTASTGAPEEISVGAGLSLSAGSITAAVQSVAGQTGAISDASLRTALGLSTVATSGAYADLSGRPSLAAVATSGAYADITGKPTLGTAAAAATTDFAAASHTHAQGDITDLSTALASKASAGAITGAGLTMSTARLLGRGAAGTGAVQELSLGNGLSLSGSTLSAGGLASLDKGTVASGTVTFDASVAGHQRLQVGGALSIATTGWPTVFGELLIELVNGGLASLDWGLIWWLKPDGSYTTVWSETGWVLNSADTDAVLLWTFNGGSKIRGKVMR